MPVPIGLRLEYNPTLSGKISEEPKSKLYEIKFNSKLSKKGAITPPCFYLKTSAH